MAWTQNLHSSFVPPSRLLCISWACSSAVSSPALKTRTLHKGWQPVPTPLTPFLTHSSWEGLNISVSFHLKYSCRFLIKALNKEGTVCRQSLLSFILIPLHAGRADLKLLPGLCVVTQAVQIDKACWYTPHYPVSESRSSYLPRSSENTCKYISPGIGGGTNPPSLLSIQSLHWISHLSWGGEC